jgi:diphosphomevalonate decarboxylase
MSDLVLDGAVRAVAHVNIALVKYWGKAPATLAREANLPAVPSLSLTLDGLWTDTRVRFAPEAADDRFVLDGVPQDDKPLERVRGFLDRVREAAGVAARFEVTSRNQVPTAAGLASSASGFAALAAAAGRAAGLPPDTWSRLARLGSGSASRSIFGGWVAWDGPEAWQVAPETHWEVALVIAVIDAGPKAVGSREAMNRTRETSPYYAGWVAQAAGTFREAVAAVQAKDLGGLAEVMEVSALRMHASAMAARPPVLYWQPASLGVIRAVERARAEGIQAGWTMDAGPNVKVLCQASDAAELQDRLARVAGVAEVMVCGPGPGVRVEEVP